MSDGKAKLIIWLACYWIIMILVSNFFDLGITDADFENIKNYDDPQTVSEHTNNFLVGFWNNFYTGLSKIPIVNAVIPLLDIMTFKVTHTIPYGLSIFLNLIAVITLIAFYDFFINSALGN